MIPVVVKNVSISNVGFVVFLAGDQDPRTLPIFIGVPEAQSIAIHINKVNVPRPITHDLMKNIMDIMEGRLMRVIINDLKEGTFYAKLMVNFESQMLEVDSRPSDAIALALRCNAPIFIEEHVMEKAGVMLDDKKKGQDLPHIDQGMEDPLERLKKDLEKAITEERYEDAARIRDEIRKTESSN